MYFTIYAGIPFCHFLPSCHFLETFFPTPKMLTFLQLSTNQFLNAPGWQFLSTNVEIKISVTICVGKPFRHTVQLQQDPG